MPDSAERIRSVWLSAVIGTLLVAAGLAFLRLELTIRSPGIVRAEEEHRIFAPADGRIARLHVQVGQNVQAGDLLVELDDTDLALRRVELDRDLAETDAALERNRIALRELDVKPASAEMLTADDRKTRLARISEIQGQIEESYASGHDRQIISSLELRRQEIEKLRSEMDLLQAAILADWQKAGVPAFERERLQVEQRRLEALGDLARRERDLVERQRAALHLTAPTAGRVIALEYRFPGMAVPRGAELAKVAAVDGRYRVRAHLPERNVDLVQVGTPALMESEVFDSMLEGYVKGHVVRLAPEAADATDAAAGAPASYEMDVAVDETPYPLVLGSRVQVILKLGKRPLSDVLFRSAHALRGRPAHEP